MYISKLIYIIKALDSLPKNTTSAGAPGTPQGLWVYSVTPPSCVFVSSTQKNLATSVLRQVTFTTLYTCEYFQGTLLSESPRVSGRVHTCDVRCVVGSKSRVFLLFFNSTFPNLNKN